MKWISEIKNSPDMSDKTANNKTAEEMSREIHKRAFAGLTDEEFEKTYSNPELTIHCMKLFAEQEARKALKHGFYSAWGLEECLPTNSESYLNELFTDYITENPIK